VTNPRPPWGSSSLGRDTGTADQPAGSGPEVSEQSIGELLAEVSRDVSTLMRQEVELAKAEVRAEVAQAGKGAGMLGGAGFAGYMLLLFLSFAAWWGLANVMDTGVAALLVAVVWGVIAAVLAVLGRSTLKRLNPKPERTIDTAKQIPTAFKGN
jgi:Putative Actinobacterial Holin-X, holin superfamily III